MYRQGVVQESTQKNPPKFLCSLHAVVPNDRETLGDVLQALSAKRRIDSDEISLGQSITHDNLTLRALLHHERVYKPQFTPDLKFSDAPLPRGELRAWREMSGCPPMGGGTTRLERAPHSQWQLHFVEAANRQSEALKTLVRSIREMQVDDNYDSFVCTMLGYRLDFEYALKGFIVQDGMMEWRVFRVCAVFHKGGEMHIRELGDEPWMVELRTVCSAQHLNKAEKQLIKMGEEMEPLLFFHKFVAPRRQARSRRRAR